MTNYVKSLIRTWVPVGIGVAIAWLQAKTGIVIDEESQAGFIAATTGAAIGIYYAVVRKLEEKFPSLGWLLGLASQPGYSEDEPPPPQPPPADRGALTTAEALLIALVVVVVLVLVV